MYTNAHKFDYTCVRKVFIENTIFVSVALFPHPIPDIKPPDHTDNKTNIAEHKPLVSRFNIPLLFLLFLLVVRSKFNIKEKYIM